MGREHFGVRKGAWTEEEDILLRKCVEKYGEGKWRQVPMRAGLNRCRKSCRLRWLNYLHPNIKLGEFREDEIDLIIRLHKLLGNRWSLIAGRLPGRTANNIKNYWNSHLKKRQSQAAAKTIETTKVIKPQPRTFSPNSIWLNGFAASTVDTQLQQRSISITQKSSANEPVLPWKNLLGEEGVGEKLGESSRVKEIEMMIRNEEDELMEGGFGEWDNMLLNFDLWSLFETF